MQRSDDNKFMPSYGEEIGKWKFMGIEYSGIVC
jgi:hypothetical protein